MSRRLTEQAWERFYNRHITPALLSSYSFSLLMELLGGINGERLGLSHPTRMAIQTYEDTLFPTRRPGPTLSIIRDAEETLRRALEAFLWEHAHEQFEWLAAEEAQPDVQDLEKLLAEATEELSTAKTLIAEYEASPAHKLHDKLAEAHRELRDLKLKHGNMIDKEPEPAEGEPQVQPQPHHVGVVAVLLLVLSVVVPLLWTLAVALLMPKG